MKTKLIKAFICRKINTLRIYIFFSGFQLA